MKLTIKMAMYASGKPEELADVERLNAEIERDGLHRAKRRATLDESHWKDLRRILKDLGDLMNRAHACHRRRPRGKEE